MKKTWKWLIGELKYKDWYMDTPGVWCQIYPHSGVCVKKVGNNVRVWNFGQGQRQSNKHGYLDDVCVRPKHALQIIDMINEIREKRK